jgi:predicted component of viral defense system (DUF524 family)
MGILFKIETDLVTLTWSGASTSQVTPVAGTLSPAGCLKIRKRRNDLAFGEGTWRSDVPKYAAGDPEETAGPRLFEQTDYKVFLRAKSNMQVDLSHRDPLAYRDLIEEEDGSVIYGTVNFRSQVGRSVFAVRVDGNPEFDFEVEVFPTKLDYRSDYEQLLADVQDILTGLALEYLRSTFQLGFRSQVPQPTHLEWLTLLRHVLNDLERALQRIAQQPVRNLIRTPQATRAEKVRRVDSSIRSAIRRGTGTGGWIRLEEGLRAREFLREQRARQTLDTPEHRWLNTQLVRIRRRIGRLRQDEARYRPTVRRVQILQELDGFEARIARLQWLEPLSSTQGDPPPGFASLQLLSAPGYRQAYQACLVLSLGLRIDGGPLNLSVKDLSMLYEYWCYLALLRLIAEMTDESISVSQLFSIRQSGLHVVLEKGRRTTARFRASLDREVKITYNPKFDDKSYLIPQQPDILISFVDPDWPSLHLILDAKYRVDGTVEYVGRYGSPGPPQDALNVLHRYRDAILEYDQDSGSGERPKHTVVQAAAAFPFRETGQRVFRDSKLWAALEHLGVGAIPLLPGDIDYLAEWLGSALRQGGWSLADRAIAHRAWERVQDWRVAASESVLIGILRTGYEQHHLDWLRENRLYYLPRSKTQQRQYSAKWVAIYSPSALRELGAITHFAAVESIDIVTRGEISTPWPSYRGQKANLQVVYRLTELEELRRPIENRGDPGGGQRFSSHRWTSKLGLDRASILVELHLETEPEWRLYEELRAHGISFRIKPGRASVTDPRDPAGRAQFVIENGPVLRYAGASGFSLRKKTGRTEYFGRLEDLLETLR